MELTRTKIRVLLLTYFISIFIYKWLGMVWHYYVSLQPVKKFDKFDMVMSWHRKYYLNKMYFERHILKFK